MRWSRAARAAATVVATAEPVLAAEDADAAICSDGGSARADDAAAAKEATCPGAATLTCQRPSPLEDSISRRWRNSEGVSLTSLGIGSSSRARVVVEAPLSRMGDFPMDEEAEAAAAVAEAAEAAEAAAAAEAAEAADHAPWLAGILASDSLPEAAGTPRVASTVPGHSGPPTERQAKAGHAAKQAPQPKEPHGTPNPRNERRARRRAELRGDVTAPGEPRGCVVLIREDCRLHDNPALHAAAEKFPWVVPLYVHDDGDPSPWPVRGAGLWWRHESLRVFDKSLRMLGSRITYRRGCYVEQIVDVVLETGATALYFNRQLEPWHHMRDLGLEEALHGSLGLEVRSFKGMVAAFEPWDVRDKSKPKGRLEDPVPTVTGRLPGPPQWPHSVGLAAFGYGRTGGRRIPNGFKQFNEKRQACLEHGFADAKEDDWAYEMRRFWRMGEEAAMERLEEFLQDAAWGCYFPPGLHPTDEVGGRFRADKRWTAILSPYLRFGDLSPRYVYARCRQALPFELRKLFTKRVVWRDKAYSQLYRWPDSHSVSIRHYYEHERWSGTRLQLRRWQRGETGFPLVDAAMRQLWKVGWMCNHLRHVTAQFLIEHLDLNWKDGFDWYDYTLVDTDVAINAMMWQMGGHSGIGAWNFVMHPVYAGKKVDPDGAYVRRWLPELAGLPVEYIHCPWDAPVGTRVSANVLINGVYWQRVIEDLMEARKLHQKHVIEVRRRFPQFVDKEGNETMSLGHGKTLRLEVRDDIRENDEDKITLLMTPDDPRSILRRNIGFAKGVHSAMIYDETKRFEAMYDAIGDLEQPPERERDKRGARAGDTSRRK